MQIFTSILIYTLTFVKKNFGKKILTYINGLSYLIVIFFRNRLKCSGVMPIYEAIMYWGTLWMM